MNKMYRFQRISSVVVLGVLWALPWNMCLAQAPLAVGTERHVFVDGQFIKSAQGVNIVVNKPRLDREALIVPEHAWEDYVIGDFTSVIQEDNRIRLWYGVRAQQGLWGLAYAESTDGGATFTKPNLGVVEFEGSTANNLVLAGGHGHHVFRSGPDAPPEERYYMHRFIDGNGIDGSTAHTNRAFSSPDGIHWTPKGDVPFLYDGGTQVLDSQNVTFWDTRLEKYVVYPRLCSVPSTLGGRAVGRAEAETFDGFPQAESPVVLQRDAADQGKQFYTSAAVQYPFASDAYYAFPAMLNGESGPLDIQFAASRDGIDWLRPDRTPIIHEGFDQTGVTVSYEEGSLYAGYGLTRQGDELSLYYTTHEHPHVLPSSPNSGIISRAVWRLDGFMSVDAGEETGQFITPTLLLEGNGLVINFDGSAGWVQVEILDEQGNVIPGYGLTEADILTGDSTAMQVTWNGQSDLSSLIGQAVQLRFTMNSGKLYAFEVTAVPEPATMALLGIVGYGVLLRRRRS